MLPLYMFDRRWNVARRVGLDLVPDRLRPSVPVAPALAARAPRPAGASATPARRAPAVAGEVVAAAAAASRGERGAQRRRSDDAAGCPSETFVIASFDAFQRGLNRCAVDAAVGVRLIHSRRRSILV